MRRLFSLIALCLALVLGAAPSFAADVAHGGQIFSANCAACHMGGGNVVNAERTRALYGQGLVAETEALIGRYGPELPLLDTIGYAEARQLLAGTLTEAEARALTQQRPRQFAKRQRTWFRRRHRPCWLAGEGEAALLEQAVQEVERGLG